MHSTRHADANRTSVRYDDLVYCQVRALVLILQAHMGRKDIVRAAMRSTANLIRLRSVVRNYGSLETCSPQ